MGQQIQQVSVLLVTAMVAKCTVSCNGIEQEVYLEIG